MVMPPQRACGAESQAKHRSSNGPLRVQSNGRRKNDSFVIFVVQLPEYSATYDVR